MSAWSALRKTCSKCGRTLPVTEFFKSARHRLGTTNQCKDCYRTRRREQYDLNPEQRLAYNRRYWRAHRADMLAWQRIMRRLAKIVGNSH